MQQQKPTPARIVESDGHIHVGWFAEPFAAANLREAKPDHLLQGLSGGRFAALERGFRRWRLKEWQYVSVVTKRSLFACAVVDVGYMGTAFAYVVDRQSGERTEWSTQLPLGRGVKVSPNSIAGESHIEKPGWGRISIENDPTNGERRLTARLQGELGAKPKPSLHVELTMFDEPARIEPVVVVEQCAPGHWLYTHKSYGLPTQGSLRCGPLLDEPKRAEALGGFDYNSGYRERRTWWNWAAAAGHGIDGEVVGFNLTAHRRWDDAGSRRSGGPDAADCGVWIDGALTKLDRVEFSYDPKNLLGPWRIHDEGGLVDLTFAPIGERQEHINFGILASQFHQPYGAFTGTVTSRAGRRVKLNDVFGVTEQHYALW